MKNDANILLRHILVFHKDNAVLSSHIVDVVCRGLDINTPYFTLSDEMYATIRIIMTGTLMNGPVVFVHIMRCVLSHSAAFSNTRNIYLNLSVSLFSRHLLSAFHSKQLF